VLRLLNLPPTIQESVERGEISEGHARALLAGNDPQRQRRVWQKIREQGISVREAERLMKEPASGVLADGPSLAASASFPPAAAVSPRLSPDLQDIEERLRRALVTRVSLTGDEHRGRIVIEYASADELDGLVQRIEGQALGEPAANEITSASPAPKRGNGRIQGLLSSSSPQP
jgi:ParB family chromosome partitioning protein